MDWVRPAAIALHGPTHEMIEGLEFIREPGWNKEEIDNEFRGIVFYLLLVMDVSSVSEEPERLTIIMYTAKPR
jgi:hypothetical protein